MTPRRNSWSGSLVQPLGAQVLEDLPSPAVAQPNARLLIPKRGPIIHAQNPARAPVPRPGLVPIEVLEDITVDHVHALILAEDVRAAAHTAVNITAAAAVTVTLPCPTADDILVTGQIQTQTAAWECSD